MSKTNAFEELIVIKGGDGTIYRQRPLVRCKDCKHRPKQTEPPMTYGFSIAFQEGSKCPCQCDDGYYSWYPSDDWFCADGEQKET